MSKFFDRYPSEESLPVFFCRKVRVFSIRVRKFLIRKLAGRMGVALNVRAYMDEKHGVCIAYAGRHGGMCESLGVK